jgi:signal peptidase I
VVTPVHAPSPEDDPERTDEIAKATAGSGDPREQRPELSNDADAYGDDAGDAGDADEEPQGLGRRGKHRGPKKKQPLWRELLTLVAVALLLTFLIQQFLGRVYSIPSGSMEKTLHGCPGCTGDRVLVDKIIYTFRDPEPGDVVVFKGPDSWTENDVEVPRSGNVLVRALQNVGALIGLAPPDERDFVKRVIAVGGQTVQCCDDEWRVLVDGRPLDEPYIYWQNGKPDGRQRFDPVLVPQGTLWVMGDNRSDSCDSTCQGGGGARGVVPVDNVIGKARFIVLPPSRWQGVGDHNPQGGIPLALGAPAWEGGLSAALGLLAAGPIMLVGRGLRRRVPRRRRRSR